MSVGLPARPVPPDGATRHSEAIVGVRGSLAVALYPGLRQPRGTDHTGPRPAGAALGKCWCRWTRMVSQQRSLRVTEVRTRGSHCATLHGATEEHEAVQPPEEVSVRAERMCRSRHLVIALVALLFLMMTLCISGLGQAADPGSMKDDPCSYITQDVEPYPLSAPGPHSVGRMKFSFQDPSRENRRVRITAWYPAVQQADSAGQAQAAAFCAKCEPDASNAPYPLILSATKLASLLAPHLVTHGFVWVSVDYIDTYAEMCPQMIKQPLDILFALEMAASGRLAGLERMIDADHAGAIGYSFDGYNSLVLSGARVDPAFYFAQCAHAGAGPAFSLSAFSCAYAGKWEEFAAHAGEDITESEDGLWHPMTDERIRAVMPIAGEGWWLFGEQGLAATNRPTLMIAGTRDELYPENTLIFDHLGTADKALISFVGYGHQMIYDFEVVARIGHFAAAFFGHHLKGCVELARFFSEAFVQQHDDLVWGVHTGE